MFMIGNKTDKSLSDVFNLEESPQQEILPVAEAKSITVKVDDDKLSNDLGVDYKTARENIRGAVSLGYEALEGIVRVATEGEHPRAYEVVTQMIKAVSDANKDLLELHHKMRIIRNDTNEPKTVNNTMNSIFVGSTKDLQDLINPKRSFSKAIDNLNEQGIAVNRGEED
jgi:hypothetical protein